MAFNARLATRRDYRVLVKLRAEWLDAFCASHPAAQRWCPARWPVPNLESENELFHHLLHPEESERQDQLAVGLYDDSGARAYLLWTTPADAAQAQILHHSPRVSPGLPIDEAGRPLVDAMLQQTSDHGIQKVSVFLHGFPDEIDPLVQLYRTCGFEGELRQEMLSHRLTLEEGPSGLTFRSASDIGLDRFYQLDARIRNWSVEESRKNLAFSQKMVSVDPSADWLVAYEGDSLVGTVQVALTSTGVGLLDHLEIVAEYRRRGLGQALLARGLEALRGRTEVVWLDVDEDNRAARRLYERAGFTLHHRHGTLTAKLPRA
jgi:GNAT superfamily N-acetyltransferase